MVKGAACMADDPTSFSASFAGHDEQQDDASTGCWSVHVDADVRGIKVKDVKSCHRCGSLSDFKATQVL